MCVCVCVYVCVFVCVRICVYVYLCLIMIKLISRSTTLTHCQRLTRTFKQQLAFFLILYCSLEILLNDRTYVRTWHFVNVILDLEIQQN